MTMGRNVLIVESDMAFAIKLGLFFGRKSFNPVFAFSIREAMVELRAQTPVLVCVNPLLRDGTGEDFLKKARAEGFDMPVVSMEGWLPEELPEYLPEKLPEYLPGNMQDMPARKWQAERKEEKATAQAG